MPFARYQEMDAENDIKTERMDVGVNYVMGAYNALISAEYQKTEITGADDQDAILLSMQYQF